MVDDPLYREARKWAYLTSGTTVLRETGQSAWLHLLNVGNPAAGTITIYNNGAASGEVLAILTLADVAAYRRNFDYDIGLSNGLTVVLSVSMNVTVIYE